LRRDRDYTWSNLISKSVAMGDLHDFSLSVIFTVSFPVYVMGLLVSVVILLILDLDRPSAGFIRVSQQPMIDTAASIDAFTQ
jgi:Na+/glutamate symporter